MSADIMPSFERFNYLLRINKHIERKLIFDLLHSAAHQLNFLNHWYLGFGSMWFGDFRLADRVLGIEKMVSIERTDYAERAAFNQPFAGITVSPGDSNVVLSKLGVNDWGNPLVAWLDYDGKLDSDTVKDIAIILQQAAMNSVVAITVNGCFGSYRSRNGGAKRARNETAAGTLEDCLGRAAIMKRYEPVEKSPGFFVDSVKEADFPEFLSDAIATYMEHSLVKLARVHEGKHVKFVPLFRLHHKDGVDMVTVGGAITTDADSLIWEKCLAGNAALSEGTNKPVYRRLDLIPVTIKEKIILDTCLPAGETTYIKNAKTAGIKLADEEISKYRKFYRHFPVFVETPV